MLWLLRTAYQRNLPTARNAPAVPAIACEAINEITDKVTMPNP
jgi:hypothetical protein